MSITAVPLRPVAKGSLTKLWLGVAVLVLGAGGLVWAGERGAGGPNSAFMADNGEQDGVITTKSGLQYKVVHEGTGASPTTADVALIGYRGSLVDGTVFDQNEHAPIPVDAVVPGFSEALQLMKKGGEYKLWIPPELGYGDKLPAGAPIPPNAVLIFDVKLLDFQSRETFMQQMRQLQAEQAQQTGAAPQQPAP